MEKLTIFSVYHSENSKNLLELNYDLVKKLNPGVEFEWILADNASPMGQKILVNQEKFKVVPGLKRDDSYSSWARGSYHHSTAVNGILPHIKTRFALSLDNDFFILRKNWISDVISHMKGRDLAFLGSPWNPREFIKIRYFPAHHSLFIDLEKVKAQDLDFRPDYDFSRKPIFTHATRFWKNFWLGERALIGYSRDTGFKIFKKYFKNFNHECLVPVFVPNLTYGDWILPDKYSFVPKSKSYYSIVSFSDMGFFDVKKHDWEEFLWQGQPFGFHMRRVYKTNTEELENKFEILKRALDSFSQ